MQRGPGRRTYAKRLVDAMKAAGYRTPDAPYSGPGSGSHGSSAQLLAAFDWLGGGTKKRQ